MCSYYMETLSMIDDSRHWRRRAEEASSIADQLDDPIAKKTMLNIVASYEQLAVLAKAKLPFKISN